MKEANGVTVSVVSVTDSAVVDVFNYIISRKTYIRYVCDVPKFDLIECLYTAYISVYTPYFLTISKSYTYIRRIYVYNVYTYNTDLTTLLMLDL